MHNTVHAPGFTLIELLVVVLIIGILSAVALPQYTKAVEKSRATEAISLLENLRTDEEAFYLANGSYTGNIQDLTRTYPAAPGQSGANYFNTKNFHVAITEPKTESVTGSVFEASAVRANNGTTYTTGDLAYSLNIAMNANGDISRTCTGSASICKTISNGKSCSPANADWCYKDTSSSGSGSNGHTGGGGVN